MNRDQILDVAAQIIRKKGFHATSMQDIADGVNLQKASLYHHVASKQEILLSLLDQALDLITERIRPIVTQPGKASEKIPIACREYLSALTDRVDLVSVLFLEHRSLEPKYRGRHIPRRDRFEQMWRQLVQEGIDSGEICNGTDAALTARTLLGVMNWTITWFRPDGSMTIEQIADYISSIALNGMLCRDNKKNP
jgi:TetR/AcrR family transcriptional regulator, cholesterol catabolism regulator